MRRPLRRGEWLALAGIAPLVVGAAISSRGWLTLFRGDTAPFSEELVLGVTLFRLALAGAALYVFAGLQTGRFRATEVRAEPTTVPWERTEALGVGALLLVALSLRLFRLGTDLWVDEIVTFTLYGEASPGEIFSSYGLQNQHFLYSLLARGSLAIFGPDEWALRLPAALFGVASIGILYVFARRVVDRTDAFLSAALLTVSYHHVWFSQNARGYSALLFATMLSSWLWLRAMRSGAARLWAGYGLVCGLGIFAHQTMLFVVLGQFLLSAWQWSRGGTRAGTWTALYHGFGLAALVTFVLHALTLPQILGPALEDLSQSPVWRDPLWTLRETLEGLGIGLGGAIGLAIGMSVLGMGLPVLWGRDHRVVGLFLLPPLLGAAVAVGIGHPLWPRFFFFAAGFAAITAVLGMRFFAERAAVVLGLSPTGRRRAVTGSLALVILASAVVLPRAYAPKQDFTSAREYVASLARPGDSVVAVGLAGFAYRSLYAPQWRTVESAEELTEVDRTSGRTWVLYTLPIHMEAYYPDVLALLERDFRLVRVFYGTLGGGEIYIYRSGPRPGSAASGEKFPSETWATR